MPFINEVLAANQQHNLDVKAAARIQGSRFLFEPEEVHQKLVATIVGQGDVVNAICQQLKVIKAGLNDPRKPLCVTLLVGETGVGKTEIVRQLAAIIHGDPQGFCRIDMNTLSQGHYSAAITGAPPGYVGSKENITLFNEAAMAGTASRPGIVLFDEIEKANSEVARSLMNILDSGKLRLASGTRELSFTNSLIFMTSNLGSGQWFNLRQRLLKGLLTKKRRQKVFEKALFSHFDPEFINRIDRIEIFESLAPKHHAAIIDLELQNLNKRLLKKGYVVTLDANAVRLIQQQGADLRLGARAIKRHFRDLVMVPLAETLLALAALPEEPYPELPQQLRGEAVGQHIVFRSPTPGL